MNYERSAIAIKKRCRSGCDRHTIGGKARSAESIDTDIHVRRVAGMGARGIIKPVLAAERIEVGACRRESSRARTFAKSCGVKMDCVSTRRQISQLSFEVHDVVGVLPDLGSPELLAGRADDDSARDSDPIVGQNGRARASRKDIRAGNERGGQSNE